MNSYKIETTVKLKQYKPFLIQNIPGHSVLSDVRDAVGRSTIAISLLCSCLMDNDTECPNCTRETSRRTGTRPLQPRALDLPRPEDVGVQGGQNRKRYMIH
ncbi:hypothetical protein EDD18DRAFT_1104555 [Armillaria luteobubalina]|uniref:Uncharacterized protein n=1 Tax=Armillaria luteobubalina TaxID=153913 RepID=A0AA39UNW4_9AGAR|nr:hypothetical protein EDD18DRAFT_1104555 [Armillaria luteobubalina]